MQTLKELHTSAKTRLDSVSRRIDALQLELDELVKEQLVLEELVEVYDKKEYDSIEEEKRVTERILNKKPSCKRGSKLISSPEFKKDFIQMYKEIVAERMEVNEAIKLLEISKSTYYRMVGMYAKEAVQDGKPVQ
jgi:uncharacterized HAD superfamily protein